MHARVHSSVTGNRGTRRVEQRVAACFGDCLAAFRSLAELAELAENLRILSLNAELAAGRAGEKGRAVRALTQYTRELVNRLTQIEAETNGLMGRTYGRVAAILRSLHQLRLLESAAAGLERRREATASAGAALSRLEDTRSRLERDLAGFLRELVACFSALAGRSAAVAEVVSASDSIATNIAIEAVSAGAHEQEFRTVAETMRRYVEQLRIMTDAAGTAVRNALDKSVSLQGN